MKTLLNATPRLVKLPRNHSQVVLLLTTIHERTKATTLSLTVGLLAFGSVAQAGLNDGLVLNLPLNSNGTDVSVNANHGTLYGPQPAIDRFGVPGRALEFNGTTDYIRVPDSPTLRSPTNGLTISLWAMPAALSGGSGPSDGWVPFLAKSDSSADAQYALNFSSNSNLWFEVIGDGRAVHLDPFAALGQWSQYAVTYDGLDVKYYINGALIGSAVLNGPLAANSSPLIVGSDPPGSPEYFKGKLDDLRIYNRALSVSEIQALYTGEVAYYPLDGDATDKSGGGNHGNVNGATPTTDRFGNANGAYQFNGASDISFTNALPLSPFGSFSYAFWMVSTRVGDYPVYAPYSWLWLVDRTSETAPLVSLGTVTEDSATSHKGQFWFNLRYDDRSSPPGNSDLGAGPVGGMLTPQQWQHIVLVRDYNSAFKLYVNGVAVGSVSDSGAALTPPILKLGLHANNGQLGLDGKIDDVRIYDRALSSAEVAELFAEPGLGIAVSQVRLCWKTRTDKFYQVQYRSELTTNTWVNMGSPIPGNGGAQCLTDEIVGAQRLYRVVPSP